MNMGAPSGGDRGMSTDQQAQAEAMHAMEPGATMDMAHMRMTQLRPANAQDRERADQLVVGSARNHRTLQGLPRGPGQRLSDIPAAMPQHEYHFNNYWNGFVESFTFDPARPTSLLYKKTSDGGWELTGAMYTAPRTATLEQLDERVPLSVARWHQHINMCIPRALGRAAPELEALRPERLHHHRAGLHRRRRPLLSSDFRLDGARLSVRRTGQDFRALIPAEKPCGDFPR